MNELAASPLRAWESFYVIVGTSAGALAGLQFVVLTLIVETGRMRGRKEAISAFGSPNVVHFCSALLASAILSAPWGNVAHAGATIAACGASGVLYSAVVVARARRQSAYQPVFEDWLWHNALPSLAYATLLVGGLLVERRPVPALFSIGAATLLLVFAGIHNAWDTVMYVAVEELPAEPPAAAGSAEAAAVADASGALRGAPGGEGAGGSSP